MSDRDAMAVKIARIAQLLAEAAHKHPKDSWVPLAQALVPDLASRYTPPCPGRFNEQPHCDEAHQHGLKCGNPADVCTLCKKTNAEHRAFRY
ncbi:MAG TPA: hypothetical protein VMJ72_01855 [Candidatus Paceibacterota bacterium]|nr:hypothetical protein [Candidatus Paceibacterota bacterium]